MNIHIGMVTMNGGRRPHQGQGNLLLVVLLFVSHLHTDTVHCHSNCWLHCHAVYSTYARLVDLQRRSLPRGAIQTTRLAEPRLSSASLCLCCGRLLGRLVLARAVPDVVGAETNVGEAGCGHEHQTSRHRLMRNRGCLIDQAHESAQRCCCLRRSFWVNNLGVNMCYSKSSTFSLETFGTIR